MDVRNCRKCGRIFNYTGSSRICPQCLEKQEEEFQKVKLYIRENPSTTVIQTAEACEVEVNQIKEWLRQERLTLSSSDSSELVCEMCGTPILSGRYCDKCRNQVANELEDSIRKPVVTAAPKKKSTSGGDAMRFLGRR
ncbi:MAG: flagellar protein [Lachnospiraceae bacterium]|nr:flagellar protein [Lachnospiraceae bacterium]